MNNLKFTEDQSQEANRIDEFIAGHLEVYKYDE